MTSHIVPAGTFSNNAAPVTITRPTEDSTVQETPNTLIELCPSMLVDRDFGLDQFSKKAVLRSIALSLNWSIIGHLKRHCADAAMENITEGSGIDGMNDALAAIAALRNEREHSEEIGFNVGFEPLEAAHALHEIRQWLAIEIEAMERQEKLSLGYKPVNNISLAYSDTLQKMLQNRVSREEMESLAASTGMKLEDLIAGRENKVRQQIAETAKYIGQIVEHIKQLPEEADEADADEAFHALPFALQLRLAQTMVKAYDKRCSSLSQQFAATGNKEHLAQYFIVSDVRNRLLTSIHQHIAANPNAVNELGERMPVFEQPAERKQ